MAFTGTNFQKLTSDQNMTVWLDIASDVSGVEEVGEPLAAEVNAMVNASPSISWNDWGFGFEASETANEPSLADVSTYEEATTLNFGGDVSYFLPSDYDDNSNNHSVVYDLTDQPGQLNDFVVRIDGSTRTSTPARDGDFAHVMRVQGQSEANPFTPGESTRRTVGYASYGEAAAYTIIGEHVITQIGTTPTLAVGDKGRLRFAVQDRDYTNALEYTTSDLSVIEVYPGGFYEVLGSGSATVTVADKRADKEITVAITVP